MPSARPPGITLIELLVVIAIIGALMAITLPAVQAARESSRKAACQNNLRQIGVALQSHHASYNRFPSNGWGFRWLGDPARGSDTSQPGGWIFNILPHLEQVQLHDLASGTGGPQKIAALTQMMQSPLPILHCPSRRKASVYPYVGQFALFNVPRPEVAAKCDYAGNGGSEPTDLVEGPSSMTPAVVAAYPWPDTTDINGVFFVRSQVRMADITDGTSMTYLVGEKYVRWQPHNPEDRDRGDDQTCYVGDDKDIRRWTDEPPRPDSRESAPEQFGSAHPSGCHFVFADGSVRLIPYSIELEVHRRLGSRNDGQPVTLSDP